MVRSLKKKGYEINAHQDSKLSVLTTRGVALLDSCQDTVLPVVEPSNFGLVVDPSSYHLFCESQEELWVYIFCFLNNKMQAPYTPRNRIASSHFDLAKDERLEPICKQSRRGFMSAFSSLGFIFLSLIFFKLMMRTRTFSIYLSRRSIIVGIEIFNFEGGMLLFL